MSVVENPVQQFTRRRRDSAVRYASALLQGKNVVVVALKAYEQIDRFPLFGDLEQMPRNKTFPFRFRRVKDRIPDCSHHFLSTVRVCYLDFAKNRKAMKYFPFCLFRSELPLIPVDRW